MFFIRESAVDYMELCIPCNIGTGYPPEVHDWWCLRMARIHEPNGLSYCIGVGYFGTRDPMVGTRAGWLGNIMKQ